MAHHFATGFGDFPVGHVLLYFCQHQGRCETSKCMVLRSSCGQQAVVSKMLTYKSTYLRAKINIMRSPQGQPSRYFAFSHMAQGKWGSRFSALSKALIIFTHLGLTETQLVSCTPA